MQIDGRYTTKAPNPGIAQAMPMQVTARSIDRVPHLCMVPGSATEREKIASVFPLTNGSQEIVVPFTVRNQVQLKLWGYDVPDFMDGYDWRCRMPLWPHQKEMAIHMANHDRTWVLSEPRTGKTLAAISAVHRMFLTGDLKRVLVIAPKTILRSSWEREWAWVNPAERVYVADKPVKQLNKALREQSHIYRVYIINTDKVKFADALFDTPFDLIIADEASKFKHQSSDRSRALRALLQRPSTRFWPMTGTPVSTAPTDVFHVGRLVNPDAFPRYFGQWRDRVMVQVGFNWYPRAGWKTTVAQAVQPSIRIRRQDCFSVPPITYTIQKVDMTPEQNRNVTNMIKHQRTVLASGVEVNPVHKAAAIQKVFQLAGGVVYAEDGQSRVLETAVRKRCQAVIDAQAEAGGKVIVVCPYTDMHVTYVKVLASMSKTEVLSIRGGTPDGSRLAAQDRFRDDDSVLYIVAHPEPIQFGVNASKANTTVWVSPQASPEQFVQTNDRMFAEVSANKQKLDVIMLAGCKAEYHKYHQLRQKELGQEQVLTEAMLFKTIFEKGGGASVQSTVIN